MTGVFRSAIRPKRPTPYLPSKTPAASPTSLIVEKKLDLLRFTEYSHQYYAYKQHRFATVSKRTSLPVKNVNNLVRSEESREYKKHYIPALTPASPTSLVVKPKQSVYQFFGSRFNQRKTAYLPGYTPAGPASFVFSKTYPERLVFEDIESREEHHYRTPTAYAATGAAPSTGTCVGYYERMERS